jgi:hypothetical protein
LKRHDFSRAGNALSVNRALAPEGMSEEIVMKIPKSVRIVGWIFLSFAVFSIWYWVAADYSYSAVAGTYTFQSNGETSTLILKKDQSFQQVLTRQGKVERVQGTWRRIGEGGVNFSKEFLPVGNVQVSPDGSTYGVVQKHFFGLIPSIVLGENRNHGPIFHIQLFR